MNVKNIYERVAELNHATPEEVEQEIRHALEVANIPLEPEAFLVAVAEEIKRERENRQA